MTAVARPEAAIPAPTGAAGPGSTGPVPVPPGDRSPVRRWPAVPRAGVLVVAADLSALLLPVALLGAAPGGGLVLAATCVALFATAGLYRSRLQLSVLDDLPKLAGRGLAALAAVALLLPDGSGPGWRAAALGALGVVPARLMSYAAVRRARLTGRTSHRTLLIGAGSVTAQLAETLASQPQLGLRVVGTVDDDPLLPGSASWLGPVARLPLVLREQNVAVVVVSFGRFSEPDLVALLRACEDARCAVFVVPRLFEVHDRDVTEHVGAVPVLRLRRNRLRPATWPLKRAGDVVLAAAALLLVLPVLALLALALRWEGGPGVLFRQERIGRHGQPFELLKLRTLRPVDDAESQTLWSVAQDSRLRPLGRFLRRSSLDELPQLWNVLRGDMSLVGPRPERPHFVDTFSAELPRYRHRHRVPSGLTGLAQVSGLRGDTSVSERARFDNYYIEHWSLWLDVKIMLRTVREVVLARGR